MSSKRKGGGRPKPLGDRQGEGAESRRPNLDGKGQPKVMGGNTVGKKGRRSKATNGSERQNHKSGLDVGGQRQAVERCEGWGHVIRTKRSQ